LPNAAGAGPFRGGRDDRPELLRLAQSVGRATCPAVRRPSIDLAGRAGGQHGILYAGSAACRVPGYRSA
jgi:hypothetical protein